MVSVVALRRPLAAKAARPRSPLPAGLAVVEAPGAEAGALP